MSSWHLGIKGLQGQTLNLEIFNPQQATVKDLKGLIYQKDGDLPPFEQRLVHMNEELQDDQRLCSYPDINDGSTLFLIRLIPFQLFIKGMDGTTYTVRIPSRKPETYSVSHLKKLVQEKTGVRPDEQRLQFGGRQLEDRMTLGDYNIQSLNTLHLVSRLRGGLASNQTIQISAEACIVTGVVGSSVRMPCGHAISPRALGDYSTAEIQKHKTSICCPRCSKEWHLRDLRQYGGLSSTQLKSIEEGLTRNFCQNMPGVVACQGCGILCLQTTSSDVECSSCAKKKHDDDSATVKLLGECPMKKIYQSSCPSIRACPKCGKLIEHTDGCRRVTCDRCSTTFCFNCLIIRPPTAQAYYNCPDNCSTAARQTVIPKW